MLCGSIVALITPFDKENNVDYVELERLCKFHLENGTDGLCILGTTSEDTTLSFEEKREIAKKIIEFTKGKIKIIARIIGNKAEDVMLCYQNIKDLDIDNYLVIDPYYVKSNNAGLINYFTYIADRVNKPIIIYNVPKRTGEEIPFDCVRALSYHKNIVGIKYASGDILYHINILRLQKEDFYVYFGDDKTMLASIALGSNGVISVIGNALPKKLSIIINSYKKDSEKSKLVFYELYGLINSIYVDPSPIGIKYLKYLIEFNFPFYSLPLYEPNVKTKRIIENEVISFLEE